MLVLSRKRGESIQVSDDIRITVVRISGNRARIGIEALDDVHILRGELHDWSQLTHRSSNGEPTGAADSRLRTEYRARHDQSAV